MQEETNEFIPSSLCLPAPCRHTSSSLLPLWVECPHVTRPAGNAFPTLPSLSLLSRVVAHSFQHLIPSWPHMALQPLLCFCGPISGKKQNKTRTASKIARPPGFQTSLPVFLWTYFKLALIPTAPLKLLCRCPHSFEGQINSETSSLDLDTRHNCSLHGLRGVRDPSLHQGFALCLLDWLLVSFVFHTLRVLRGRASNLSLCLYSLTNGVNSQLRVLFILFFIFFLTLKP